MSNRFSPMPNNNELNINSAYSLFETPLNGQGNINLDPLLSLINKWFSPLQKKYEWGSNLYYYLAGKKGVHPTFVQEMLGDPTFSPKTILSNIDTGRIPLRGFRRAHPLYYILVNLYLKLNLLSWIFFKN